MRDWKSHIISGSCRSVGPTGRPDTIFYLPEHFGGRNFSTHLDEEALSEFFDFSSYVIEDYNDEFETFAHMAIGDHSKPTNKDDAFQMYLK